MELTAEFRVLPALTNMSYPNATIPSSDPIIPRPTLVCTVSADKMRRDSALNSRFLDTAVEGPVFRGLNPRPETLVCKAIVGGFTEIGRPVRDITVESRMQHQIWERGCAGEPTTSQARSDSTIRSNEPTIPQQWNIPTSRTMNEKY